MFKGRKTVTEPPWFINLLFISAGDSTQVLVYVESAEVCPPADRCGDKVLLCSLGESCILFPPTKVTAIHHYAWLLFPGQGRLSSSLPWNLACGYFSVHGVVAVVF